jgi:hypothetical protein
VSALDNTAGGEDPGQSEPGISPSARRLAEALFDRTFYLHNYPEIRQCGLDPLDHYLRVGWREGRDPSATFSTEHYLQRNSDVRIAEVCPLVHYATVGILEGRPPNAEHETQAQVSFASARKAIASALPLAERVKSWQPSGPVTTVDASVLSDALAALSTTEGFVVALSHDDYATVAGGVQNCIAEEARAFADERWAYLHLCPAQPLPVLAEPSSADDAIVWARLDGKRVGAVTVQALAQALQHADFGSGRRLLVLHHLMGFAPELVLHIAEAFRPEQTIAWTHDFFTLCPSYALLRNNVAFCGGPPPDSQACGICAYGGAERNRHLARMQRLFERLQPTVLSPSETALKFWLARGLLSCRSAHAVPLGTVTMDPELRPMTDAEPGHLRICFLGFPLYHKGWHVFAQLALRHADDPRYSFYQLGAVRGADTRNITFVEVVMNRERPDLMIDAVAANRIDVVVNWSLCYETFSFTAHEAIAGGAFVLAPKLAGNVVPAILRLEQGVGLDSEQELFDLFASGDVFEVAKPRRRGKFVRRPATAWHIAAAIR